jgi:hypothetical protein
MKRMDRAGDPEGYARSYIDEALEVQKRLGHKPKVSQAEYENAVRRTAAAFAELRGGSRRKRQPITFV